MTRLNPTARPSVVRRVIATPQAGPRPTLLIASLGTFVALAVYCAPLGNLPTIADALQAGPAARTWILSSMSIGLAAVLLTAGALADDLGRRRVFGTGLLVLAAASVLCAVATAPEVFIAGRVIQGVGAAGIVAAGLGLLARTFTTPAGRAAAAGVWGASVGAGITAGPLLAGVLDLGGLWRWFYWALLPVTLALAAAARARLAESRADRPRRPDPAGMLTLGAAMVLLLVALVEGRQHQPAVALTAGTAAVVLAGAFLLIERRRRDPMLELQLFRSARFTAATVAALATGAGVIALMSFACTFLVSTLRLNTLQAAGMIGIWSALSVTTALLARRLPTALTGGRQLAIGLAGVGVGMLTMIGLQADSSPWQLLPGLIIAGVASGILNAALGREAVAGVPPDRAGLGSGANNTARYLGSSIGVTLVGIIAIRPDGGPAGMTTGWDHAALVTALISLAGAAVVAALSRPASSERPVDRRGALPFEQLIGPGERAGAEEPTVGGQR